MAQDLKTAYKGFLIWRNADPSDDRSRFLGEFYPPDGQLSFSSRDLEELGLAPGSYTILPSLNAAEFILILKWQTVIVPDKSNPGERGT